jgi:hypothetical protein
VDLAWNAIREARREQKLITGLLYINPKTHPFDVEHAMVDEPLASLPLETVRPPRAVLDEMMRSYAEGSVAAAAGGG